MPPISSEVQHYDSVQDVPLVPSTTDRVLPRQVSTGNSRGDMIVKGRILIVDDSGTVRVDFGYDKDQF